MKSYPQRDMICDQWIKATSHREDNSNWCVPIHPPRSTRSQCWSTHVNVVSLLSYICLFLWQGRRGWPGPPGTPGSRRKTVRTPIDKSAHCRGACIGMKWLMVGVGRMVPLGLTTLGKLTWDRAGKGLWKGPEAEAGRCWLQGKLPIRGKTWAKRTQEQPTRGRVVKVWPIH